jgi:hypothetical protein
MKHDADHGDMVYVLAVIFLVVIGPLAVYYGADSRLDEPRR